MELLNKDELYLLATQMDLPSLLNLCSTSHKINSLICGQDRIWQDKLDRYFPEYKKLKLDKPMSLKDIFVLLYSANKIKIGLKYQQDIYRLAEILNRL